MKGTADFGDHITCSFPKDTNRVFDDPATLHTTVDVLDPHASPRKLLIEDLLFVGERATTRFLERCDALNTIERKCQEAKIL